MTSVTVRLSNVRRRITDAAEGCGRPPGSIRLVAVSKTHPVALIREAAAAGQRDFGENYVKDAIAKVQALADLSLIWHFIGHIQSNKTRAVAESFHWVHTVDRERVAVRLDAHRPPSSPPLNVCLQVRIGGESSKGGVEPANLGDLARCVAQLPRLRLRGLMCLPPRETDQDRQRLHFRRLKELYLGLRESGLDLDTLSMGMTGDLEAAIFEGATQVRIGTAIFGPRLTPGENPDAVRHW